MRLVDVRSTFVEGDVPVVVPLLCCSTQGRTIYFKNNVVVLHATGKLYSQGVV